MTTPKQIRNKLIRLYGKERIVRDEIEQLRASCPHENLVGEYRGNTGNWCPQDDSWWINAHCKDCDKQWMIDSKDDAEEYRNFKGVRDYGY